MAEKCQSFAAQGLVTEMEFMSLAAAFRVDLDSGPIYSGAVYQIQG